MNSTKYSISVHSPKLWNEEKEEEDIQSYSLFQKKIKSKLIKIENETATDVSLNLTMGWSAFVFLWKKWLLELLWLYQG